MNFPNSLCAIELFIEENKQFTIPHLQTKRWYSYPFRKVLGTQTAFRHFRS